MTVRPVVCLSVLLGCSGIDGMYRTMGGHDVVHDVFPIVWSFDCGFPDDDGMRDQTRAGFVFWDDLVAYDLFVEGPDCSSPVGIHVVDVLNGRTVAWTVVMGPHGGWRLTLGDVTLFRPWTTTTPMVRTNVVAHEVGHVLGLMHTWDVGCVMYPTVTVLDRVPRRPCRRELDEFRRVYGR